VLRFMEWISMDVSPADQQLLSCSHRRKVRHSTSSAIQCYWRGPQHSSYTQTAV